MPITNESVLNLQDSMSLFFSTLKLPASTKKYFMTNPLYIIFVDFGI